MDRAARGKHYEMLARQHLEVRGLNFIAKNYRCHWGEIDLVMRDKSSLVFIEVRFRGRGSYFTGVDSVDLKKQKKLCRSAMYYLATKARADTPARFDVVAISQSIDEQPRFEWIKNAFDCN